MKHEDTQQAFMIIERMAAICNTPGIDIDTQKKANEVIQTLIERVVKPSLLTLTAKASGLITT